jgi:hypothetical protein
MLLDATDRFVSRIVQSGISSVTSGLTSGIDTPDTLDLRKVSSASTAPAQHVLLTTHTHATTHAHVGTDAVGLAAAGHRT